MTHGCTVVFYHYVRDVEQTPFTDIKALSVADFAAQLDWLASRFDILDGPAFERAVAAGRPFAHPTALLTFDDGLIDHYEQVFPILAKRGLGGIFFISGGALRPRPALLNVHRTHFLLSHLGANRFTAEAAAALERAGVPIRDPRYQHPDHVPRDGVYRYDEAPDVRIKRILNYEAPYPIVDRLLAAMFERHLGEAESFARSLYLSRAHVREMARAGMTFGFHTDTHPVLSRLDRASQLAQLGGGVRLVQELTGQDTVSFCYPYGFTHTYNADTLELLDECGYSTAFNTVRREALIGSDSRFEIPRFDTRDVPRQDEVAAGA
jgi:peptidoglycan/xylan/chitin deacetylase (PgdA/CDA1 family)